MTSRRNDPTDGVRDAALRELRERAQEIRDAVRVRVLTAGNLRHAAESANESAEDVAQTVFLKLWAVVRDGNPDAIRDLKAYAKKMADNHIASLVRRPIVNRTEVSEPEKLERLAGALAPSRSPEELVEHRLSAAQIESLVSGLSDTQQLLIKMRAEFGMTVPEMAKVVGESRKSCEKQLERAIEKVKQELTAAEDLDAADRRRLSRVMAVKRWATPGLIADLQRDMRGDMRLASLWRQSNGALHDVAGAVAVDASLSRLGPGAGVTDRALGLIDRGREAVAAVVSRASPSQEAAAGTATGGAGLATKAMVAACIAGPAAGGACVATGVVDLPADRDKVVVEDSVTDPAAVSSPASADPQGATTESDIASAAQPEKPVEQVNKELALGAGSSSGSSSGSRDFAAPVGGGGGGNGGGSGGGNAFGFEK